MHKSIFRSAGHCGSCCTPRRLHGPKNRQLPDNGGAAGCVVTDRVPPGHTTGPANVLYNVRIVDVTG